MQNIANRVGKAILASALALALIASNAVPSQAKGHETAVLSGTIVLGTAIIGKASKNKP